MLATYRSPYNRHPLISNSTRVSDKMVLINRNNKYTRQSVVKCLLAKKRVSKGKETILIRL